MSKPRHPSLQVVKGIKLLKKYVSQSLSDHVRRPLLCSAIKQQQTVDATHL